MVTDEMVKEYRDLFPKQTLPSGKAARANPVDVKKKLEKFIKDYKYGWNTILLATSRYVERFSSKRPQYLYMRSAEYFIMKTESGSTTSDLATECETINEPDDEEVIHKTVEY